MKKKRLQLLFFTIILSTVLSGCGKLPNHSDMGLKPTTTLPNAPDASTDNQAPDQSPATDVLPDIDSQKEKLGFTGANIGMGGLMAGDGNWIYYRSETDWGLYKAHTDGSEQTLLLPVEEYSPSYINVLDNWVYFSNYQDNFSIYRARTDGTCVEKLVNGYCCCVYVTENGVFFDWRDDNNGSRTFYMNLDGSGQTLLAEGYEPVSYYDGIVYLYDFHNAELSAYDMDTGNLVVLSKDVAQAAYFSADDSGIYYWENMNEYCHMDQNTSTITVIRSVPIGDYYNYADGVLYYTAYGGNNNDYVCCYAMDIKSNKSRPILSLSDEMFDIYGEPIGLTISEYRTGQYEPEIIPRDADGWPLMNNELASELYVVNGQVFARGRLKESMMAQCWIFCNGEKGELWE